MKSNKKRGMAKRLLALILCGAMLLNGNVSVFATEGSNEGDLGTAEHVHTEDCYTYTQIGEEPECGKEAAEGHTHIEACFEKQLICEIPQTTGHTHSDECKGATGNKTLSCGMEESEEHAHVDDCYTEEIGIICGQEEITEHAHAEECYSINQICELEEVEAHTHNENCYKWEKVLTCTDDSEETLCEKCNTDPCSCEKEVQDNVEEFEKTEYIVDEKDGLAKISVTLENAEDLADEAKLVAETVTLDEDTTAAIKATATEAGIYVENMSAFDISFELEVADEDGEGTVIEHAQPENPVKVSVVLPEITAEDKVTVYHVGTESVTTEDGEVKEELKVENMNACVNTETAAVEFTTSHFSVYVFAEEGIDPATVDVETAEIWEATLPELTGVYGDDVAAIAKSQLNYKQSEVNVETDEEGNVIGYYNRYGAWNETPYAAWNALFVKFCVSYAKVPVEKFPVADTAAEWVTALSAEECGMFIPVTDEEYVPFAGDLVFFDDNEDGIADRVAVIVEIAEDGTITTVEEADGVVANSSYAAGEVTILGYGMMPMNIEEEAGTFDEEPEEVLPEFYVCGKKTHKHDDNCYDTSGTLICEREEHKHSEKCVTEEYQYKAKDINENINVTLYNYGSYINVGTDKAMQFGWHNKPHNRNTGGGGRPFEGIDGPARLSLIDRCMTGYDDMDGPNNTKYPDYTPKMSLTLNAQGYPHISKEQYYNYNKVPHRVKDISLEYLFPKNGKQLRTGQSGQPLSDYSKLREDAVFDSKDGYNSNYESMRFDMLGDGGLFVKDANGYYTYDSANASAYYSIEENRFLLNNTLIAPDHAYADVMYKQNKNWVRNFFPFNEVNFENIDQFRLMGDNWVYVTQYDDDGEELEDTARMDLPDLWFGMQMEFDFFIPKNGMVNGKPMEFLFNGDDDVWVYIDGVLVLDIGGTHGPVEGRINFATGEVFDPNRGYSRGYNRNVTLSMREVFEDALGEEYVAKNMADAFDENGAFVDYSKHTLKFFYMERGGNISYCKLKFNMPQLPEGSLSVGKELEVYSDGQQVDTATAKIPGFVTNALSYEFRVLKAGADGKATDQLYIPEGTKFSLVDEADYSNVLGTGTIGKDGYFTLKAGQVALFEKVLENYGNHEYIVEERIPTAVAGTYGKVEFTADTKSTEAEVKTGDDEAQKYISYFTHALTADETQKVTFTNKVNIDAMVPLNIMKVDSGNTDAVKQDTYKIKVWVGEDAESLLPLRIGTKYDVVTKETTVEGIETEVTIEKNVNKAGIIELKAGETAALKVLPGTSYRVEEVKNKDYFYYPIYENREGHISFDEPVATDVTVTNIYAAPISKKAANAADGITEIGRAETYTVSTKIPMLPAEETNRNFFAKDVLAGADYVLVKDGEQAGKVAVAVTFEGTATTKYAEVATIDGKTSFALDLSEYIVADNANFDKSIALSYDVIVKDVEVHNVISLGNGEDDTKFGTAAEDLYTGKITLTKYAGKESADNVASNAEFKVYKVDGETTLWAEVDSDYKLVKWVADEDDATEVSTKEDGTVTVKGLDAGTYSFKEVKAPAGCDLNTTDVSATLALESGVTVATAILEAETKMIDTLKPGYLVIEKVLKNYNVTNPSAVFTFEVKATDKDNSVVYNELITMNFTAAGVQSVEVGPIPAGTKVVVTEVYSGAGYTLSEGFSSIQEIPSFNSDAYMKISFTNEHNNVPNGANCVVNHYVVTEGNWSVTPEIKNPQTRDSQEKKKLSWQL